MLQISTLNSGCDVFIFMGRLKVILTFFTHLTLIVSMKTQTDNYIIYNYVILDWYEIF